MSQTGATLSGCTSPRRQGHGYPFEVPALLAKGKVSGVVLADQIRCLDWRARNASRFASITAQCTLDVSAKVKLLLP